MPDPSQFSVNERSGEYFANVNVRGTFRLTVKADSIEEARKKVEAEIDNLELNPIDVQLDDIDEIEAPHVQSEPKMYRVWDGDKKMQVSRLTDTYTPREPDERGF